MAVVHEGVYDSGEMNLDRHIIPRPVGHLPVPPLARVAEPPVRACAGHRLPALAQVGRAGRICMPLTASAGARRAKRRPGFSYSAREGSALRSGHPSLWLGWHVSVFDLTVY